MNTRWAVAHRQNAELSGSGAIRSNELLAENL